MIRRSTISRASAHLRAASARRYSTLLLLVLAGLLFSACPPAANKKIAVVLPLTGEYSQYGEAIQRGLELAHEELVAGGSDVTIEVLDSQSDPATGRELLDQSMADSIGAIGGATSAEALEGIQAADSRNVALLSPTASSPELSGASRNFFRIFPSGDKESAILAGFIANQLQSERLAILYQNDPYGTATAESIKSVYTGEVVAEASFEVGDVMADAVAEIVEADPQAVYVAAIGEDLASAIRELRAAGIVDSEDKRQWVVTGSPLVSPAVLESAGDAANRVFLAQTAYDITSEQEPVASFVKAYEAKYGNKPGYYAAHGYDVMRVAAEAANNTESGLAGDFIKALRAINNFPGVTGSIQFREGGDVQKFTRVFWIVDGVPVDYEDYIKRRMDDLRKKRQELERKMEENARKLREGGP